MRRELRDWVEELACRAGLDGLPRPASLAGAAVAAVMLLICVWRWGPWSAPAEVPPRGAAASEEPSDAPAVGDGRAGQPAAPASVTVHVVGAVAAPGVYALASGARASDAVAAAGGLRPDAEASAVNLARTLADGEQLVIPVKGAVPAAGTAGAPSGGTSGAGAGGGAGGGPTSGAKVNLNTADVGQLDGLPGVGPSTAQKIVADREANGPFRRVEDLMRVTGIGPKKFESLKDLVTTG